MTIPWIKCSERMPPDDESKIITMAQSGVPQIGTGNSLEITRTVFGRLHPSWKWIPYDEATWKELNRC